MSATCFFDTNILVYAAAQPDKRSERARTILAQRGLISVQVLNEFTQVAIGKLRLPWPTVRRALGFIDTLCPDVLPLHTAIHRRAVAIAEKTGYRFYDALIVASALEAGCRTLYSEDLQHGQLIEASLTIVNPFII